MIDTNSLGLKLLYEQNMPFWKKKWFRFNITLILCAALGFLIFLAVNKVYIQGTCPNIDHNLYNTSQPKIENLVSLEYYNRTPNSDPIRMTRLDATLKQDLISMTSELNNGIKELNSEIKRLYSVLTRFDQVNRGKRGITEQTAIVDCVQMKGNFEKISADLNRISRTLSMIDENGTYHCKCPLGMVIGTPTEVTDLPMELTTFTLENINRTSAGYAGEKTKQLKKVILSDYKPQVIANVVDNIVNNNNKLRDSSDKEIIDTPTTTAGEEENRFTVRVLEKNIITTQKETDMITEPKEDIMSPDTSNAVTNMLTIHGYTQMVESQTSPSEAVTKDDFEDVQQTIISSSETPKTSTESATIPDETIAIGVFDYDGINSTEQDEQILEKEVASKLIVDGEVILRSTTELVPDFERNESNNFAGKNPESTTENDNISEPSTETSEFDKNENNYGVSNYNLESTTTLNDNTLKSTTETSDFDKDENNYKVTKERFELTTVDADTDSESTAKTSDPDANGSHVVALHFELTSAKQNVEGFTTQKPISNQNDTTVVGLKGTTFAVDRDKINFDEAKDEKPVVGRPKTEGTDVKGTARATVATTQQVQQQPKWYPVCFYPVPCPPNVLNRRKQDAQDESPAAGGTIQYSAQSLKTHKRIAPVADATVIQNSYPIISYCPAGMVCPMTTDLAGQANMLHCMLKSTAALSETQLFAHATTSSDVTADHVEQNASNRTTPGDLVDNKVPPTATNTSGRSAAREREEILTGDLDCPLNTFPCMDNSGCVETDNWCDGRVHCNDASDETQCNCKERIEKDKLCDGYYDCPGGEDELGCFGCNNERFSCGDWNTVSQSSSCFERQHRCDFTKHCLNGRDEDECTLLSRHLENPNQMFFVSYSTGYLHHNWKGNWYPMCGEDRTETWAEKACSVESGEKSKPSKIQYVNEATTYVGPYINIDATDRIELLSSCEHRGILVECEPETCGIRSDLKLNKNIDADRMRRSPYSESLGNATSRFARSKDPRVVGGTASNPGAWPWLIALYRDGVFHCGGVILSDQWVLTAAHCVNQYQKHIYEVQAGILRRFSFSPMEQSRTVTHVVIHTQYVRTTMENDLAMLRLEPGLEFNRWIRPVCLPDPKLDWIPFPGTICTAVGWGATVEHGPDPDNMREVEVPILAECTHKADIEGKEICAGYLSGGHDTCQGDSGGPLLCRVPSNLNKWYVAGIVSHGEGCARPMEPGVYTRVALFMSWIIKVTDDNDLPTERPQQYCPGIRCKTGKQCIPTKRQCDKYVDCMNAEDEQNCDYTGSQYQVNFYRSRNTDHSNLRYSKLKSAEDQDKPTDIISTSTAGPKSTATTFRRTNVTTTISTSTGHTTTATSNITTSNTTTRNSAAAASQNKEVQDVETQTAIDVKVKNNNSGPNDTILDAIRQLFDNQFSEETYSCGRITQVVLSNHRCDGTVDCEDGSDEHGCDCKTRLASVYGQSAICDGIVDCDGGEDEMGCGAPECKPDETICGRPKICVKKSAWCDGVVDCGGDGSDERHCTTITNGTTAVETDATGRPTLHRSGMVAVNRNGVWRVRCVDKVAAIKIAHDTCSKLHFTDSKFYEKRLSWNNPLPLDVAELNLRDMCHGLYVECGHGRKAVEGKLYHWHADIMVDGRIVRSGVLMEDSWVLVKRTIGFSLDKTYVTAVLGNSAHSSAWIKSPYRQIARVDAVRQLPGAEFDLLHLDEPANVSAGVTPLGVPLYQPAPGPNDTCYAIGYADNRSGDRYHGTETVLLRTDAKRRCDGNALCFAVSRKPRSCSHGRNISHVTAIVCESSNFGLFLAAPAVQSNINFCDRNTRIQLPIAEDLMNEIAAIADKKVRPTLAPVCDGIRCELGNCVPWEKVCDGVSDCLNEQDETFEMCRARTDKCKTNDTLCICEVGSFRCANGKCTPKTTFCNGIDECGDGTDEPKTCRENTCVDYLKLTAPERLCDGRWDCLDKTDEQFTSCPAGYCNRTNVYQCQSSSKCISSEFVCDGEEDCPESDDEAECIGFIAPAKKKNEGVLATRSYGNWHAQCITEDYTDVDYHSLCRGLGFRHAVGIRKTAGTKVDFDNFTIVQLNNSTDVAVRSATKDIVQHTDRPCTVTYVVCSASRA